MKKEEFITRMPLVKLRNRFTVYNLNIEQSVVFQDGSILPGIPYDIKYTNCNIAGHDMTKWPGFRDSHREWNNKLIPDGLPERLERDCKDFLEHFGYHDKDTVLMMDLLALMLVRKQSWAIDAPFRTPMYICNDNRTASIEYFGFYHNH